MGARIRIVIVFVCFVLSNFYYFFSETNRLDQGLIFELWNKGVLWDKLIGVHFVPLNTVEYSNKPNDGMQILFSIQTEHIKNLIHKKQKKLEKNFYK